MPVPAGTKAKGIFSFELSFLSIKPEITSQNVPSPPTVTKVSPLDSSKSLTIEIACSGSLVVCNCTLILSFDNSSLTKFAATSPFFFPEYGLTITCARLTL